jgi:hypothetical protein
MYGKQESLLDVVDDPIVEYYLVMTGPKGPAASSRGATRPLVISAVYLFNAGRLLEALRTRGVKIGVASSVRKAQWEDVEVFPRATNGELMLSDEQRTLLALFASPD